MGMFDDLRCLHPDVPQGGSWQTKDLNCEMDLFEIRADGSLWREEYDVEDRSDPNATGIMRLAGLMTRVNKRWVPLEDFTGEIRFYRSKNDRPPYGWLEYSAYYT